MPGEDKKVRSVKTFELRSMKERKPTWTVRSFLSTSEERVRKNPVSLHRSATEAVAGRKGVEETQPAPRGSDEVEGVASVPAQRGEGRVSF